MCMLQKMHPIFPISNACVSWELSDWARASPAAIYTASFVNNWLPVVCLHAYLEQYCGILGIIRTTSYPSLLEKHQYIREL